jgi:CubicO group peptidase (beta-lactamase class C family)
MNLTIFLCLVFIFSSYQNNVTSHQVYCGMSSRILCGAIFISHRNYSKIPPYLEDIEEDGGKEVNLEVDYNKKTVKATSKLFPNVFKISKYFDVYRGCILDTEEVPTMKRNKIPNPFQFKFKINQNIQNFVERQFLIPNIRTRSIIVFHNGNIIAEKYSNGFNENTPQKGWSLTKSILNCLYGILEKENKLNLNDKIAAPEWRTDDPRNRITIDDALKMSSGLNFSEIYDKTSDPSQMFYNSKSTAEYVSRKNILAGNGTRWSYSSGDSSLLSRKLRSYFNSDEEYLRFAKEKLFDKLDMSEDSAISVDPSFNIVGGAFGYLTARDWLKFGMLYLQNGVFNNNKILSDSWIKYSTTPTLVSRNFYTSHFWFRNMSRLNSTFISASGHKGQRINIFKKLNLIIVRLGLTINLPWNEINLYENIIKLL